MRAIFVFLLIGLAAAHRSDYNEFANRTPYTSAYYSHYAKSNYSKSYDYAWEPDTLYKYNVYGRQLAGQPAKKDQFAGIFYKGQLYIQLFKRNIAIARFVNPEYTLFNQVFPDGWKSHFADNEFQWQPMPLSGKSFFIYYKNGVIYNLGVDPTITNDEANILKAITGLFQSDLKGEREIKYKYNQFPRNDQEFNAAYKVMEPTLTGECECFYDVSPVPNYMIYNYPYYYKYAEQNAGEDEPRFFEIVKTYNHSNCAYRPGYHFGITGMSDMKPNSNQMGDFFYRSTVSRQILSGTIYNYTYQSIDLTQKVVTSPRLYESQDKVLVVSYINATLYQFRPYSEEFTSKAPAQPVNVTLSWSYNFAFDKDNLVRQSNYTSYYDNSSSSSDSSDSSSDDDNSSDNNDESNNFYQQNNDESNSESNDESNSSSDMDNHFDENPKLSPKENLKYNKYRQQHYKDNTKFETDGNKNYKEDEYFAQQQNFKKSRARRDTNEYKKQQMFKEMNADQHRVQFNKTSDESSDESNMSHNEISASTSSSSSSEQDSWECSEKDKTNGNKPCKKSHDSSDSSSSSSSDSSDSESYEYDFSSSSLDSSSEEYLQPKPSLEQPAENPFLPFFTGYRGSNIKESHHINLQQDITKLAREIAKDLLHPAQAAEKDTLEKYNILSRLCRVATYEELKEVADQLFTPIENGSYDNERFLQRRTAWKAFRDALAQAGSNPAFLVLKSYILDKKIYGFEAAQVLAVAPYSLRAPTSEFMKQFFELITSQVVLKQRFLNSTAPLAFANFMRRAQVDNKTAYNYYPVQAFGYLSPRNNQFVYREVIPYFAHQLKEAVKYQDSHKFQVYVRALGNLGHPAIVKVFEPYLEDKIPVTPYQRFCIAVSFNRLAQLYPKYARSILYRIYQNVAEEPEIRSVAVFLLMRTSPPVAMLQRIAEFTNQDPSTDVAAAAKTALQSAANLEGYDFYELAQNARAALKFVNPKYVGVERSTTFIRDFVSKRINLAYHQQFSYVGSQDHLFPKAFFNTFITDMGGVKRRSHSHFMFSSFQDFLDDLDDIFETPSEQNYKKSDQNNANKQFQTKWSAKKVADLLDMQPEQVQQLEGQFFANFLGAEHFFAFGGNNSLKEFPDVFKTFFAQYKNGKPFGFTKFAQRQQVTIAFPMAAGFPFVYTLKNPLLMHAFGGAQIQSQPDFTQVAEDVIRVPKKLQFAGKVRFLYTVLTDAKVGFTIPFIHKRVIAGVQSKRQVYLPADFDFEFDFKNQQMSASFKPQYDKLNNKVFHLSNWPYTGFKDIDNIRPISEQPNFSLIHVRPTQKFERYFGQQATGFNFRVSSNHDLKYFDQYNFFQHMKRVDFFSALLVPSATAPSEYHNFNVEVDFDHSYANEFVFFGSYNQSRYDQAFEHVEPKHPKSRHGVDGFYNEDNYAQADSTFFNSERRQYRFMQNAAAGIHSSYAHVFDFGFVFKGQKAAKYIATFAYADSPSDNKQRFLFFGHQDNTKNQKYQICLTVDQKYPQVPALNFQNAIKQNLESEFNFELNYGEKCQGGQRISIDGKFDRTNDRKEYVEQSPLGQECYRQMAHGVYLDGACRNVTARAYVLNEFKFDIDYSLSKQSKEFFYRFYRHLAHPFSYFLEEDFVKVDNKPNKVSVYANMEPHLGAFNFTFKAPSLEGRFRNVRINNRFFRSFFAVQPTRDFFERFGKLATQGQFNGKCQIGTKNISTFDNYTYSYELGKCWHAAVINVNPPHEHVHDSSELRDNDYQKLAILVRETGNAQKEFMFILGQGESQPDYVLKFTPNGKDYPRVYINEKLQQYSEKQAFELYTNDGEYQPFVRCYGLPYGEIKCDFRDNQLKFYYDGYRAQIEADSTYRDDVYGLCGTYNGEGEDDFSSPHQCVLQKPHHFVASWALTQEESCQGPAKAFQVEAKNAACYKKEFFPGNIVSDRYAGRAWLRGREAESHGSSSSQESDSNSNSSSDSSNSSSDSSNSSDNQNDSDENQTGEQGQCVTKHQVQYVDYDEHICFTKRPLPTCQATCKPATTTEKWVDVYCVKNDDGEAVAFKQMIRKGINPDMNPKPVSKALRFQVASNCVPKHSRSRMTNFHSRFNLKTTQHQYNGQHGYKTEENAQRYPGFSYAYNANKNNQ